MNNYKTVNININNQTIPVDKEMANIVITLNDLGYKTSGCCFGSSMTIVDKVEAWIIIQEINETKMVELMKMLNNCNYTLTKELYKKDSKDIVYVQYILKTPKCNYREREKYINNWYTTLLEAYGDIKKT